MKNLFFILIAMLACIPFTTQAQDDYWNYSWTETQNGGPVWSPDFQCGLGKIDTASIDGTQYLYASGHFALEDKHGDITIEQAGLLFYDGTNWLDLRPTSAFVLQYFYFQGNEYIATYDDGMKVWDGSTWQNCWGIDSAVYFAFVDTARDRVIYGVELPAALPGGDIANHTFIFSYNGIEETEIGKFRGAANDYDQIANKGYVTVGPVLDGYLGYTLGIFAIDLDSLVILPTSLEDYPIWAGSIFYGVETNFEGTALYAREVLGGIFVYDGIDDWQIATEDGDYWSFTSCDEGMIVGGDNLCKFTSFYEDGEFNDSAFKASNGNTQGLGICKYKGNWYAFRQGGLSEWYRASLYIGDDPYADEWMNSNIITRMLTADIPPEEEDPVSINTNYSGIENMYPNPATNTLTIETHQAFIPQMYAITGERVYIPTSIAGNIYTLDVSTLPRGLYTISGKLVVLQ